jgi:hypothetical protein
MVKRSFLPGQPLSPAIPEVRRGPSRFLQVTSDRSRGSQTPSSDTALVARGSVPQPPPTHKTAPSTWTCSNHAAPQATSAVISPLLAQDCLTRLCLITLRSTLDPILLRTAVRRGAGRTAECHLRRSGRGGGQPLGRVVSGGASGRCPGRRASPWSGRPRCPPYRPLPVVVHHWVSTRSGSPSGPVSSRPVSDHRVSGRLVPSSGTGLSGRLVPPSGVQPSGVRPSVLWRPSCPGQPAVALGTTPVRQALHGRSGSGSRWPARVPRTAPSTATEPGRRRRCGGRGRPGRGGCRSRTWAGLRWGWGGGRARPLTDQGGQPGLGLLVASG